MCLALSSHFAGSVERGSEEGLRSQWQEAASRAKVWGGVCRQREQLLQSPQDSSHCGYMSGQQ